MTKRYMHDFDLIASVTTEHEEFEDVPVDVLIDAMEKRLEALKQSREPEAFGHVSTQAENGDTVFGDRHR